MRKAQYSLETLFVISISSVLLLPAIYLFYDFVVESTEGIVENQISRIGNSFVENANLVYNYGNEARIVADFNFPENILNMSLEQNRSLVFVIQTNNGKEDHLYSFGINVTADFQEEDYNYGKKSFEFQTIRGGELVSIRRV